MSAGIQLYKDGIPIFNTSSGAVRILGMWHYGQILKYGDQQKELFKIPLPDIGGGSVFAMFVNSREVLGSDSNAGTRAGFYYVENNHLVIGYPNEKDRLIIGVYYDSTN